MTEGESIQICVQIEGRANFVIDATLQPVGMPGSAQAGADFTVNNQLVRFPALSSAHQCVQVQTMDDGTVERDEEFRLKLTLDESERVILGDSQFISVTILDNDCMQVLNSEI